MKKLLFVDDDKTVLRLLQTLVKAEGKDYHVSMAEDAATAIEMFRQDPADLVLIDFRLPGMDGLQLLEELKRIKPDVSAILMSAYLNAKLPERAEKMKVKTFLQKPFRDMNKVIDAIDQGL